METIDDIQYEIRTWTSDIRGAGTDANVFIQLYGTKGHTDKIQLKDGNNNFEQGREDVFVISVRDVGTITKIKIGHDGSRFMSGWHLNKVFLKEIVQDNDQNSGQENSTGNEYWFFVDRWFDTSEDDHAIERELIPTDEKYREQSTNEPVYNSTQRTNDKADPFYVASAYDKEPRSELYVSQNRTVPDSGNRMLKKTPSRKSALESSLTNQQAVYSPITEENTQPVLDIHTEDTEYYNNDFLHHPSPDANEQTISTSRMSTFLQEQPEGVVGSIKRTLQLLH